MRNEWMGIAALALTACAGPELKPAPGAAEVPGNESAAVATEQGVRLVVDGGAWSGTPAELDEVVPVLVRIDNGTGRPLRIRYDQFRLLGPGGSVLAALPPLSIEGVAITEGAPVLTAEPFGAPLGRDVTGEGFYVAEPYGPYYTGFGPWLGPFAYDRSYYQGLYSGWPVELPTADMLQKALPEGVVEPGGSVSGFLYFQDVPDEMEQVGFLADLVDADTGATFGRVAIPMIPVDA